MDINTTCRYTCSESIYDTRCTYHSDLNAVRNLPRVLLDNNLCLLTLPKIKTEEQETTVEEKAAIDETNPKDRLGILKPQLHLVPPASILYEALAMEDGANKYGPYNWRLKKVKLSIYISACKRHLDEYWDGENEARDSKKPHLAHAKACLGIIIDALETGNLIDDRPTKGSMSDLIERFTKKKTT